MTAETILILFLCLFALHLAWENFLLLLNLRRGKALRNTPAPTALEIWGEQEYRRAVDYTGSRTRLAIVSSLLGSALLLVMVLSGWLGALETWIASLSLPPLVRGIAYVYLIALIFSLVSIPVSLYARFGIEERFGFNRMSWRLFLLDTVKGLLVSVLLLTPLLAVLFALIRSSALWWLWGFFLFSAFQLVMIVLYPRVIAPLFNRFTPLEEGSLKQRITALAGQLGFATRGIYLMDGSKRSGHGNAYFSGLGRLKRIVLFDTLVEQLREEEIAGVLAHEIGHEKRRHILKRLCVSLPMSLIGFWVLGLVYNYSPFFEAFGFSGSSPQAAVVLAMFISAPFTFPLRPLFSWWSRRHEYQADAFVQTHTEYGPAFQSALKRMGRDNLSNPVPHPLFSFIHNSHPTILERIRALERSAVGRRGSSA